MPSIAAISIFVHDLTAAEHFYTTHLGFTVASRPAPVIVELSHDGVGLVLCQANNPVPLRYGEDAGTVIGIGIDDVDEALARLSAAGVSVVTDTPQEFPQGRFIAVRDPSGNVVELLQFG